MNNKDIVDKFRKLWINNTELVGQKRGYYNIGLDEKLEHFLLTAIQETREELIELAETTLTTTLDDKDWVDEEEGRRIWKTGIKENQGIEPCQECGNRDNIIEFLDKLKKEEGK